MEKIEIEKMKRERRIINITIGIIAILVGAYGIITAISNLSMSTFTIKGLMVDNQTSGSFALGFGSGANEDYFVCYVENSDAGLQLKRFSANNTTIYQTLESDEEPYVEIVTNLDGTKNKLYIPKDTIQVEYNLSLTE